MHSPFRLPPIRQKPDPPHDPAWIRLPGSVFLIHVPFIRHSPSAWLFFLLSKINPYGSSSLNGPPLLIYVHFFFFSALTILTDLLGSFPAVNISSLSCPFPAPLKPLPSRLLHLHETGTSQMLYLTRVPYPRLFHIDFLNSPDDSSTQSMIHF